MPNAPWCSERHLVLFRFSYMAQKESHFFGQALKERGVALGGPKPSSQTAGRGRHILTCFFMGTFFSVLGTTSIYFPKAETWTSYFPGSHLYQVSWKFPTSFSFLPTAGICLASTILTIRLAAKSTHWPCCNHSRLSKMAYWPLVNSSQLFLSLDGSRCILWCAVSQEFFH